MRLIGKALFLAAQWGGGPLAGEQMTAIAAVASIRLAEFGHAPALLVDQRVYPAFEDLGHGLAGALAVVLAPLYAFGLEGLHHG